MSSLLDVPHMSALDIERQLRQLSQTTVYMVCVR